MAAMVLLLRCVQVVAVAATFCEVWSAAAALIAELDVLAGFADLATADPYCKPEILDLDGGEIELKVGRDGSGYKIQVGHSDVACVAYRQQECQGMCAAACVVGNWNCIAFLQLQLAKVNCI